MENGQKIKTTINGVPVELTIHSIGPADPNSIQEVQNQIAQEGINDAPLKSVSDADNQPVPVTYTHLPSNVKPWFTSKTVWFNAIAVGLAGASGFGAGLALGGLADALPARQTSNLFCISIDVRASWYAWK